MVKRYSKFALLFFIAAFALRFALIFFSVGYGIIALYVLIVLGLAMLFLDTFAIKDYGKAFVLEKGFGLHILPVFVAVGFFTDFVCQSYALIERMLSLEYKEAALLVPLALSTLFDILSCFYFVIIAYSYSRKSYDFRLLNAFHFAPLLWIVFKAFSVLTDVVNLSSDYDGIVFLVTIAFGVIAIYSFVSELENDNGAKRISVLSFRCFSFMSTLNFAASVIEVLSGEINIYDESFASSLTMFVLGVFMYLFARSIFARTKIN